MGKITVILILGAALAVGAGIWYAQTRGYYAPVDGPVTLSLAGPAGVAPLSAGDVRAIASPASPLGFRACFTHEQGASADLRPEPRTDAAPTIAPGWFDCFDAGEIDAMLIDGTATAYTGYPNAQYGVDRVVALAADGRGWAWHQLNDCGDKAYDGTPTGPSCPDRDTFQPLVEGSF
ncbi:DUF6446 family protein [uncultured Jannaschia sp.]|uniref:DUF6446 family protein n=1 Tax=uncultured Jannaschia sp. TaxID=293347 RepID=UPI00263A030E|nr:DUF6446 family protein [uncultured Jannaschia sp.]